jgi:hypothetical protein
MSASRLRLFVLLAASAAGLSACADDYGYGYGMSAGYGPRGGYACDPNYYDCRGYGYDSYADYGGYYGDPWYGWYGDYFYPGVGLFVFDSFGHRFRMDRDQHRFWEGRRGNFPNRNWNDQRWQRWDGFRGRGNGVRGQGNFRSQGTRQNMNMGGHMGAHRGH